MHGKKLKIFAVMQFTRVACMSSLQLLSARHLLAIWKPNSDKDTQGYSWHATWYTRQALYYSVASSKVSYVDQEEKNP
jgi:hypothetical protein